MTNLGHWMQGGHIPGYGKPKYHISQDIHVVGGKNAILTKGNMRKRKWVGDTCCRFCEVEKNINHLFFDRVVARVIWGS
jgi:hypothetical protein